MEPIAPKRVLLIGWDAADWQMIRPLMDAGEMPNLKRFVDEGVSGNVATLQPPLSPMLWTSIATGKTADKHGVLGFAEADGTSGRVRPVTSTGRTCSAIWNILSNHGKPAGAINWYASHPAERIDGFVVTDRFAHPTGPLSIGEHLHGWATVPESVWPAEDLEALARTRIHPQMITQEQVLEFVPGASDPGSASWDKIRELRVLLAHCATVHNAATAYIQEREWSFLGIYYDAIDRFAHAFMEHHPPRMDHVSAEDFALYSGVMNECYRYHDLMLGRLMNLVDEDTAVVIVSDHGFHSGSTRPEGTSGIKDGQPASWHRPYGVLAFWGPGIKKGGDLYGATLLDITPTILTMLGMPPARDMDGLPLTQIWEEPRLCVDRVETYETGNKGDPGFGESDADVDEQIMHQLRQLGYLGSDKAEDIIVDRARNLGTVFMSSGRAKDAIEQFQKVLELKPETEGIRLSICACLLALSRTDEAETIAMSEPESARRNALLAMICTRREDFAGALGWLVSAQEIEPSMLGLDTHIGRVHVQLNQWGDAESAYTRALMRDPDDAEALDGIGLVYQNTDRSNEAVLAHTQSIALMRNRTDSHLHLGEALISVQRFGWAIEAFTEAAQISPLDPRSHDRLGDLYANLIRNKAKETFHRQRAARIREIIAQRTNCDDPESRVSIDRIGSGDDHNPNTGAPGKMVHDGARDVQGAAIILVSGLPRSGTSLMMQMLDAGGVPSLKDNLRAPDENNPRGYHELDAVKHSAMDSRWLDDAPGHATKVIHALLRALPSDLQYSVIFMKRDLEEVVSSQSAMLDQLGRDGARLSEQALKRAYVREYERTGAWLSEQPNFRVHEVSYNRLIAYPDEVIAGIEGFLGVQLDTGGMRDAIDPTLYRQRRSVGPAAEA